MAAPMGRTEGGPNATHISPHTERQIQAYMRINRLLQAFIDHVSFLPNKYSEILKSLLSNF